MDAHTIYTTGGTHPQVTTAVASPVRSAKSSARTSLPATNTGSITAHSEPPASSCRICTAALALQHKRQGYPHLIVSGPTAAWLRDSTALQHHHVTTISTSTRLILPSGDSLGSTYPGGHGMRPHRPRETITGG